MSTDQATVASEQAQFETAVRQKHEAALLRFLYNRFSSRTNTRSLVEETLEDTLAKAWEHREGLPEDYLEARKWLIKIASNGSIDRIRSLNRTSAVELDAAAAAPGDLERDIVVAVSVRHSIHKALSTFGAQSEDLAVAMIGRIILGVSIEEALSLVAAEMGSTVESVRTRWKQRIVPRLREYLAESGFSEYRRS